MVVRVDLGELHQHSTALLADAGLPAEAAGTAAYHLLDADLRGLRSHGVAMLPSYLACIKAGGVSRETEARVVADSDGLVILDGRHALGQLTSAQATDLVTRRASRLGIGAVGVRHAHHFGAASTWSIRIAEAGMIGIALSNSAPMMPVPGGSAAVVGNNPISIAAVGSDGRPVVADLAASVGSVAKIRAAARHGEPIPDGWAHDVQGIPTTDPTEALAGTLAPIGDAKGFALALLIEVLTGVLTGGPYGAAVSKFSVHPEKPNDCAHLFIAIDPGSTSRAGVSAGVATLAATVDAADVAGAHVPGRWRSDLAAEQLKTGVAVDRLVLEQLGFSGRTW